MALSWGALTGAVFGAYDVVYHGPRLFAVDVLVAMAMAAVPGAVLMMAVAVIVRLAAWALKVQWHCSMACAVLAELSCVTLAAALVLLGTRHTSMWLATVVIAFSAGVAGPLGAFVSARRFAETPVGALAWLTSAICATMLAACGFVWCAKMSSVWIFNWIAPVGAIGGCWFACRIIPRQPMGVLIGAVALLALMSFGFSRLDYRFDPLAQPPVTTGDQPPNVVLIVLDTTRRDRIGCYGNTDRLTPVFDALATDSVVYEDAYSPSPWTMPSHASMFTGLHPMSHGCSYEHHAWLDDEFDTLAEILSAEGYQTWSLISNFYLGRSNVMQGFERVGFMDRTYEALALHKGARVIGVPAIWVDQGAGETTRSLDQWFVGEFEPDQPLFLFVNLFEAHEPYIPPYAQRAEHVPPEIGFWSATELALSFDPFEAHVRRSRDERTQSIVRALYDAEIAYQDEQLGRLLNVLEDHLELDNTLLIVTSDHGENLGDAGRWEHLFAINDDLIHVPLLIRYPARFNPGTRVSGLCQLVDLFGTALDVTGAKSPGEMGQSADAPQPSLRSLAPDRFEAQEFIYAQVSPFPMVMGAVEINRGFRAGVYGFTDHERVIHDGRNKLIWSSEGEHRLYDVVSDPLELIDRSADDPLTLERLMTRLAEWRNTQPAYIRQSNYNAIDPLDDEWSKRLRDIGYVK